MAPFHCNDTEAGKDESKCVSAAASFSGSEIHLAKIEIDFFVLSVKKQKILLIINLFATKFCYSGKCKRLAETEVDSF